MAPQKLGESNCGRSQQRSLRGSLANLTIDNTAVANSPLVNLYGSRFAGPRLGRFPIPWASVALHIGQHRPPRLFSVLPRDDQIIGLSIPSHFEPLLFSTSLRLPSRSRPRFPSFNCPFSRRERMPTHPLPILQNITRWSN